MAPKQECTYHIYTSHYLSDGSTIWFVATLRNDVDNNASEIVRTQIQVESIDRIVRDQSLLLARIDENLKAIKEAIERSGQ